MVCLDGGWHRAGIVVEKHSFLGHLLVNCPDLPFSISCDRDFCVKGGRGGGEGNCIRCS